MNAVGETDRGMRRATGRGRVEWFAALDGWGAADRPYRDVTRWLTGEHGLSAWWAQKLVVEYQQARGLRAPGVRPDGTFTVTASVTVAAPAERLYAAFIDPGEREGWLPGAAMRERTSRAGRSARFDWAGGATVVAVDVSSSGAERSRVSVQHERLPDAETAAAVKAFWKERLAALRERLESR